MATVINIHTDHIPSDAIRIMRGTKWGNPFKIGRDGDRERVVQLYRQHLWLKIKRGQMTKAELAALHHRTLACCCKPKRCHGDVLAAAARWAHENS